MRSLKPVYSIAPIAFLSFSLLLSACASLPPITESKVEVELLSKKQVTDRFGVDQKLDPFIAPTGVLKGKPYDFVVLRLKTELVDKTYIQSLITAKDKDGNASLSLWSKSEFKEFWREWETSEAKTVNREALIEDFYFPGETFSAPKGRNEYYIVLIGKNPLNKPITVSIDVNASGLSPYVRSFTAE